MANPAPKAWRTARDYGARCLGPTYKEKTPTAPAAASADQLLGPTALSKRGDPLTVVFLIFPVLAQGGTGGGYLAGMNIILPQLFWWGWGGGARIREMTE